MLFIIMLNLLYKEIDKFEAYIMYASFFHNILCLEEFRFFTNDFTQ